MRTQIGLVGLLTMILMAGAFAQDAAKPAADQSVDLDAPYVPTSAPIVKSMLTLGQVGPNDIVYDLGSGDGRLPIAAVRDFGAKKGVGIDLDPVRVEEAQANAKKAGVEDRVTFHQGDMFAFDFSEATVMPLYLLPEMMARLRPKILDMKPGTRIVAHDYALGDWEADKVERINNSTLYFWIVPAKAGGTWTWRMNGRDYTLDLGQTFQKVSGTVRSGDAKAATEFTKLTGDSLTFEVRLPGPEGTQHIAFDGKVAGDSIQATVIASGRTSKITAKRPG